MGEAALAPVGMAAAQLAQVGLDGGRHLMRASVGAVGAVGQGVQPAGPIAAQPAVDRLAADAVAVGDLDHREPVSDDFHDGVEALLCHCELQEHAPDLLASPVVGEAEKGRAVMSTINRISTCHDPDDLPAIRQQPSLASPQIAPCRFDAICVLTSANSR